MHNLSRGNNSHTLSLLDKVVASGSETESLGDIGYLRAICASALPSYYFIDADHICIENVQTEWMLTKGSRAEAKDNSESQCSS